jgi:type II secretory pathway component PulK
MRRAGFVLPVVLVVIGLLALTMAGFTFFVRAEVAGAQAKRDGQQARLAALSGFQEVVTLLRVAREDPSAWWDVPEEQEDAPFPYRFRNALLWSEGYTREDDPLRQGNLREDLLEDDQIVPAWRYSVVAMNLDGEEYTMRYGITPEAGKLNINAASEDELRRLLEGILPDLNIENTGELVDALLDWLDEDDEPRPNGAEREFYEFLEPGYYPKNGPLDTIEELLLIKGFSAAILYGEDVNRNGILDENEDDGDESFPYYDNADGVLNLGLAPYITVWSREAQAGGNGDGDGEGGGRDGDGSGGDDAAGDGDDGGGDEGVYEDYDDAKEDDFRQSIDDADGPDFDFDPNDLALGEEGDGQQGAQEQQTGYVAKIDVNSAPLQVLMVLDGMTEEAARNIVEQRGQQETEARKSLDWLVNAGAVDPAVFDAIKDKLTTQAYQFRIEILGYADHLRTFRRYEWIVEVRGTVVQTLYHRDLSRLGLAWPVNEEEALIQRQ